VGPDELFGEEYQNTGSSNEHVKNLPTVLVRRTTQILMRDRECKEENGLYRRSAVSCAALT
jgi:hypothetical protein